MLTFEAWNYICIYTIISTLKQGCKACIKVSLSEDCQYLVVSDINENYNHDVNKV